MTDDEWSYSLSDPMEPWKYIFMDMDMDVLDEVEGTAPVSDAAYKHEYGRGLLLPMPDMSEFILT